MNNNRVIIRNFKDHSYLLDDLHRLYSEAYNVPIIRYKIELTDEYSYLYCKARKHFTIVFPFGQNRDILMTETFFANKIQWLPISGSVRLDRIENFFTAALRLSEQIYPNINLGELEPIAILENKFTYQEKECIHLGIAFVARIRNNSLYSDLYTNKSIRGQMINFHLLNNKDFADETATQWDKLVALVKVYVSNRNIHNVQEGEISGYLGKKIRYQIHNKITKPFLKVVGQFAFKYKIADITKKMEEIVLSDNPNRIIDIACGDNPFIIKLAHKHDFEMIVANDLSWFQLQDLQKNINFESFRNTSSTVIFTNHDAKSLPFKDKFFDVLICKNVLHHMDNFDYLKSLIGEMNRISKKVVIVEVLDPLYEGRWGRFRHKYIYDKLLKEVEAGDNFLSREAFKRVCEMENCISKFEMPTARAVYQFCIFNNDNLENEEGN